MGEHIGHDIETSLRRRRTRGGTTARSVEDVGKRAGARLWLELKRHPYLGIVAAGAGGVAIAATIGVGELALGIAIAYGAYNVLVRGESPEQAAALLAHEVEEA